MFDGQYKQRPDQSYGKVDRKGKMSCYETIRQAAEQRKLRELKGRQESSAVVIQSWCRTHFERKKLRIELRFEFDAELRHLSSSSSSSSAPLSIVNSLVSLSRRLICLYKFGATNDDHSSDDRERLVPLCQKMLSQCQGNETMAMMMMMATDDSNFDATARYFLLSIKKLLEICCGFVRRHSGRRDAHLAIPLRMLDTFTKPETFLGGERGSEVDRDGAGGRAVHVVEGIKEHLCNTGYFSTMKTLLDNEVPATLLHSDNLHRVPKAEAVLDLIRRFLYSDGRIGCVVHQKAAEELFNQQLTNQMRSFLLPLLSEPNYPYISMLQTLSSRLSLQSFSSLQTLNLVYSVTSMGEPHFGEMQSSQLCSFAEVISALLCRLNDGRSFSKCSKNISTPEDDDDDDDDDNDDAGDDEEEDASEEEDGHDDYERMEWFGDHEAANEKSERSLQRACFERLGNNIILSHRLMKLLSSSDGRRIVDDEKAILSLCKICYNMIGQKKNAGIQRYRILGVLGCSPSFIEGVWELLCKKDKNLMDRGKSHLLQLARASVMADGVLDDLLPSLSTFCSMYSYHLQTLSDCEFVRPEGPTRLKPFGNLETVSMVALTLRDCCLGLIELTHPESRLLLHNPHRVNSGLQKQKEYLRVFKDAVVLTKQLYERDCRIRFCPAESWVAPGRTYGNLAPNSHYVLGCQTGRLSLWDSSDAETTEALSHLSTPEVWKLIVLKELPFAIKFNERVDIFRDLLNRDKPTSTPAFLNPATTITIRRKYIYEDAFTNLQEENVPDMRTKLHFSLISHLGTLEVGIDGGGVFRETLREVIKAGFNPELGFFEATSDGLLHPNHLAGYINNEYLKHFYFLGRMLGKAIYARLLIDLPLASFFLVKLLSQENSRLDIHHLSSLDPDLHRGLMSIRSSDDDVSKLHLDFTLDYDMLGRLQKFDLKPNGSNILVDNTNKFEYIHLVADWYLNKRIRSHCMAFRKGLGSVVDMDWLRVFDHNELQFLISGANVPIDLKDLQNNTNYSGGYTAEHEVVRNFWSVVDEFTEAQRQDLLKFVTCSPRAPLYGFKELRPSFCIHYAGPDSDRLPTASTCMNQLKLPAFDDRRTLREKLLMAIEHGAGFELS